MKQISIGDKIYSSTTDNFHVIESVENIEGHNLVFTEDSKCFPIQCVFKSIETFYDLFERISQNQPPSEKETESFYKSLIEKIDRKVEVFDVNIFCQTGIKIKPYQAC